jgi:uncharacterized Zn-finger protein
MMTIVNKKPACSHKKQTIRSRDLPLSCPPDTAELWNAHPKVYLPIEKTGEEICPYCGTRYLLKHDK